MSKLDLNVRQSFLEEPSSKLRIEVQIGVSQGKQHKAKRANYLKAVRLDMRFLRRQNQLANGFEIHDNLIKFDTESKREPLSVLKRGVM